MKTEEFDYHLPEELIAQTPVENRDCSRLLILDRKTKRIAHKRFYDIVDYIKPGDALVVNDTRVIKARLMGRRSTGGRVEVLLLNQAGPDTWECLVRPGHKLPPGERSSSGAWWAEWKPGLLTEAASSNGSTRATGKMYWNR